MLKVPLPRFVKFVQDAENLDLEYPCLKQREWLLKNWRCNDETAIYDSPPKAKRRTVKMPKKSWDQLVTEGKTLPNGEICCFVGCNTSFQYSQLEPQQYRPKGWSVFVLPKETLIGVLCQVHARQFPTEADIERNLASFDRDKMLDPPED